MGKYEIRWDAFEVWMFDLDIQRRKLKGDAETDRDKTGGRVSDSRSRPSRITDMTFGDGQTRHSRPSA